MGGYFTDPNTGKRVWAPGIASAPNPVHLTGPSGQGPKRKPRSKPKPSATQTPARGGRGSASGRAAVGGVMAQARRDLVASTTKPRTTVKSTPKASRTVPSNSPVSNGPPSVAAPSGKAPSLKKKERTKAPKVKPKPPVLKGMTKEFKRAYVRYTARHKNVPQGTAMNKVEDLVTSGPKAYTSKAGFKGKGLKPKPDTPGSVDLGPPDQPPASALRRADALRKKNMRINRRRRGVS